MMREGLKPLHSLSSRIWILPNSALGCRHAEKIRPCHDQSTCLRCGRRRSNPKLATGTPPSPPCQAVSMEQKPVTRPSPLYKCPSEMTPSYKPTSRFKGLCQADPLVAGHFAPGPSANPTPKSTCPGGPCILSMPGCSRDTCLAEPFEELLRALAPQLAASLRANNT